MPERLTRLDMLAADGLIADPHDAELVDVARRYAVAITSEMAAIIDRADPADPIAAQFVPTVAESEIAAGENDDPIGDRVHSPVPGIVHRYGDRVLLKAAAVCPVYCRFCFRRAMVGPDNGEPLGDAALAAAIAYIAATSSIFEVIVTGGDPLMLSPRRIAEISSRLGDVAHVQVVRWHSRVPVVAPELIDADRLAALVCGGKAVYVAVHANHPREFTQAAKAALARLANAGVVLVGQSVLLKGVNDADDVLADLMRAFVANRVRPYYVHMLDAAPGTAHFRVPLARAQALVRGLRGHVSGLCQPTLVVDIPGGAGKVNATPCDVVVDGAGVTSLIDRDGHRHRYSDGDGDGCDEECDGGASSARRD